MYLSNKQKDKSMKKIILATILSVITISEVSMAREAKAAMFRDLAVQSAKGIFGVPGDQEVVTLKEMDHSDPLKASEKWEVILSNGAAAGGSGLYEVTIKKNDIKGAATIDIKAIAGE